MYSIRHSSYLLSLFIVVFLAGGSERTLFAVVPEERPLDAELRANGIDPGDIAAVKTIAKSHESYYVRKVAIKYLAAKGVDVLAYLFDPILEVRVTVADLLLKAGRDDGMAVMVEDFKHLTRSGLELDHDHFLRLRDGATENREMVQALDVAKVLADGGDLRGMKLATLAVADAPLEAQRYRAVLVLEAALRMARTAREQAVVALSETASKEKTLIVIDTVVAAMQRLKGDEARAVLTRIRDRETFPHPLLRERVTRILAAMEPPSRAP